jgi:hypothetical protein
MEKYRPGSEELKRVTDKFDKPKPKPEPKPQEDRPGIRIISIENENTETINEKPIFDSLEKALTWPLLPNRIVKVVDIEDEEYTLMYSGGIVTPIKSA